MLWIADCAAFPPGSLDVPGSSKECSTVRISVERGAHTLLHNRHTWMSMTNNWMCACTHIHTHARAHTHTHTHTHTPISHCLSMWCLKLTRWRTPPAMQLSSYQKALLSSSRMQRKMALEYQMLCSPLCTQPLTNQYLHSWQSCCWYLCCFRCGVGCM